MPKILYFITEDSFLVSHFLPMTRAAREAGFEVVVAARVRDRRRRIEEEGCRLIAMQSRRGINNPIELASTIAPAETRARLKDRIGRILMPTSANLPVYTPREWPRTSAI